MDENQKNKQICDLLRQYYPQYKMAALFLDRFTGATSLLALKEVRDAIDHLAQAAQENEEQDDEYVQIQIEKAKGHFARAVYDICDAALIESRIRLKALSERTDIDLFSLNEVISKVDRLTIEMRSRLLSKTGNNEIDNNYVSGIHEIVSKLEQLETQSAKRKPRFFGSQRFWNTIIALLSGVLLSLFLQWLFARFFGK